MHSVVPGPQVKRTVLFCFDTPPSASRDRSVCSTPELPISEILSLSPWDSGKVEIPFFSIPPNPKTRLLHRSSFSRSILRIRGSGGVSQPRNSGTRVLARQRSRPWSWNGRPEHLSLTSRVLRDRAHSNERHRLVGEVARFSGLVKRGPRRQRWEG